MGAAGCPKPKPRLDQLDRFGFPRDYAMKCLPLGASAEGRGGARKGGRALARMGSGGVQVGLFYGSSKGAGARGWLIPQKAPALGLGTCWTSLGEEGDFRRFAASSLSG